MFHSYSITHVPIMESMADVGISVALTRNMRDLRASATKLHELNLLTG